MRRISSRATFFNKRIFPVIWFGFLSVFVLAWLGVMGAKKDVHLEILIMPAIMAIGGYFVMKRLVFDLVDEVWDSGDALIIKNKDQEERVPLHDVINVSDSTFTNPPRITLTLCYPCRFGREITFSPPLRFFPFRRSPIAIELIERINAARKG